FLYTDIFVIKLLSDSANIDIANYSFSLNIASMLLLIPITLVQVDVEKLKRDFLYVKVVNRKIIRLVALLFIGLIAVFYILTQFFLPDYRDTFIIFLIILMAKAVQSAAPLYGTMIVIKKRFRLNLNINIISLVMNVILSSLAFYLFGLYGIAFASLIVLAFRNVFLVRAYKKIYLN
ncbi:MAG: hypothetical protein CMC08_01495, partial [Flavobacteriaceae bacterium]|nr:hypothetical protein [Flavobacteriaceae bacterium]